MAMNNPGSRRGARKEHAPTSLRRWSLARSRCKLRDKRRTSLLLPLLDAADRKVPAPLRYPMAC
jgi:hypothetical protein